MKILFILMCYFCAVLLSALTVLVSAPTAAKQTNAPVADPGPRILPAATPPGYLEQKQAEENLMQAIIARQEEQNRKEQTLQKRESELALKTSLITRLLNELAQTRQEMEADLSELDENQRKNSQKLAEFYSKMEANNAAQLLYEIEPERAALILTFLSERDAGGIMDAAVALGPDGIKRAVTWSEIIRKMKKP
jgi:flagellar motility protein MotE (MotC chaperone)